MGTAALAVVMMMIMSPFLFIYTLGNLTMDYPFHMLFFIFLIALAVFMWKWLDKVFDKYGIFTMKVDLLDYETAKKQVEDGIEPYEVIYQLKSKLHPEDINYIISGHMFTKGALKCFRRTCDYVIRLKYGDDDELEEWHTVLPVRLL